MELHFMSEHSQYVRCITCHYGIWVRGIVEIFITLLTKPFIVPTVGVANDCIFRETYGKLYGYGGVVMFSTFQVDVQSIRKTVFLQ